VLLIFSVIVVYWCLFVLLVFIGVIISVYWCLLVFIGGLLVFSGVICV